RLPTLRARSPPELPPWLEAGPSSCSSSISSLSGWGSRLVMVSLLGPSTGEAGRPFRGLRQTELGELSKELAGQDISGRSSFGQVLRRVGFLQITPALVCPLGPRVDEDQPVFEHDPPAPV